MRNLHRNKRMQYIASILDTEEPDDYGNYKYGTPFQFLENLAPVSGESEIATYGDRVRKMYKATPPFQKWHGKIKENDLAYLDGVSPDGEAYNGCNANYKVESVRETLNTMTIYFEKLPLKGV